MWPKTLHFMLPCTGIIPSLFGGHLSVFYSVGRIGGCLFIYEIKVYAVFNLSQEMALWNHTIYVKNYNLNLPRMFSHHNGSALFKALPLNFIVPNCLRFVFLFDLPPPRWLSLLLSRAFMDGVSFDFLRKQIFPFSVLALELLYQSCIAFKIRFDCIDMFAHVCVGPLRKNGLRF